VADPGKMAHDILNDVKKMYHVDRLETYGEYIERMKKKKKKF